MTEERFHITGPWPLIFDPRYILFDLETKTFERFETRAKALKAKLEAEADAR